ncbi:MAG: hypothetical protein WEB06_17955 [Actinomycetota bacterium]
MAELDKIVAAAFLAGTAGVVLVRALRAWTRFRLQERTLRILTKGLTELERPRERPRT